MASTVTYNGVENAEGGTIFKDVKFWMATRIPQRSRWIDLIKQNGGVVVPLEKHADMLIADHARAKKDAPLGSYSWQFIEDSVKNGIIQLKDRYLIGPPPNAPRPVGSGQPTKSTRTPFTREDDARIARWVLEHPTDQKGNEIWKEYACINARHTAQSWRDRYVKKLANLDRVDLERMAASAPEETLPDNHGVDQAERPPRVAEQNPPQAAAQTSKQRQRTGTREDRRQLDTARQHQQETPLSPAADRAGHQIQPGPVDSPEEDARDTFYRDLDDWIASTDRDVKRYLKIEGVSFELFDLALAAQAVLHEIGSCDWIRIAEKLGFVNPTNHMLNELHLCYQENLDDFLAQIQNFEDEPVSDSEAIAPGLDLSQGIKWEDGQEEQDGSPQTYERSSPPVVATGLKRSTAHRPLTSSGNVHKKRRYHSDDETPSIPDNDLAPGVLTREPSPSVRVSSQWLDNVGESEASQHLPPLPPQLDESQDYRTTAVPPQETRQQSVDVDPLPDDELIDSTPIPFHLNKTSQDKPSATKRRQLQPEPSREHRHNSLAHVTNPRRAVSSTSQKPRPPTEAVRRSLPASYNSSRNRAPQNPPDRSSQPREPDSSNSREIQERISYYESMGFPRHIVIEGLKRTTLTPGKLALLVMQYLTSGRGVPSRHEGIWTDRDDEDLRFSSSVDFGELPADDEEEQEQELAQKAHNRLVKKHGRQRFELRKAFLEAQTIEGKHGANI
ncbi:hypothetical protein LB507_000821 [Fusarium sp. FIESC RH6]|nr:hypothetical protein LB507_000821 [Fusarium sp. FIESC RH6]